MFTNLPTGSVPLYGAKPPDVSQFKRKMRVMDKARNNLTNTLQNISQFFSTLSPDFAQSNKNTNSLLFSFEFIMKVTSKLSPESLNIDEQITNPQDSHFDHQNLEPTLEGQELGSLENLDKPSIQINQFEEPQPEEVKPEVDEVEIAQETDLKEEKLEQVIQENSETFHPIQNEEVAQDTQQDQSLKEKSESLGSLDPQTKAQQAQVHENPILESENKETIVETTLTDVQRPSLTKINSSHLIDEPTRTYQTTIDYASTLEHNNTDIESKDDSQSQIKYLSQSLEPATHKGHTDSRSNKTKSVKSEEESDYPIEPQFLQEKKKLQRILDPLPYEHNPARKRPSGDVISSESQRFIFQDMHPQDAYHDEFRKMMKQKANYDVQNSFFPIKGDAKLIPRKPGSESKKNIEISVRKIKKSNTLAFKGQDGLPIILEHANFNAFPGQLNYDSSKTFEPGRRNQTIQLPSIDAKSIMKIQVKKPPKNLNMQSLSVNNLNNIQTSLTPSAGSSRIMNLGENLALARKIYSEKVKPTNSAMFEKGSFPNSPIKLDVSGVKSPKWTRPLVSQNEHQIKFEPMKNIKIRKIANPIALKKANVA